MVVVQNGHTIVLLQAEPDKNSRTFYDFQTLAGSMAGIAQIFENQLRALNPHARELKYNLSDMYEYIDRLPDISLLVFDSRSKKYEPCGKEAIKKHMMGYIQSL